MLRLLFLYILSTTVSLAAGELSYYFTLSGKLYTTPSHTTPMTEQNIPIRLQILNSSKTCILYDETQLVSTDTTDGAFSIQVGSDVGDPKRVVASDPGNAMTTVFQNTTAIPATCAGNSAAAVAKSGRYLRITVTHPITSVQDTLSPDVFLGSMPTSLVAETLGGLTKDQFLQLGAGSLTQANVESVFSAANYPVLAGLIGGTAPSAGFNNNTNYIITADADSNGSGAIQFAIGASTKAQITNSGDFVANQRIGVGTAAPTYDISLSGEAARTVGMERDQNVGDPGKSLTLLAGAAGANGTDQNGGTLYLSSGMSTGSGGSSIGFMTATPGATGTTDRSATLKMILDPLGYLGLGNAAPDRILHITSSSAPTVLLENSASAANARRRYLTTTTTGDLAFGKFSDDMSTTTEHMRILSSGNTGLGVINPTATLQLKAGTAAAGTAPLKLTAGVNLTTPEDGAIEYDGTNLYYTDSTNTRRTIATGGSAYSSGSTINAGAGAAATPSLSFSTDTDTGLYSSAANTIGVSTGGSQIFTMSSSGLVSSTAGGGSVSTAAGTAAAPTFSFAGDTDTGWYAPLANTLAAATGGTERVRIDSSGNVGIGTTNPGTKLEVIGDMTMTNNQNGWSSFSISNNSTGTDAGTSIDIGNGITGTSIWTGSANYIYGNQGKNRFAIESGTDGISLLAYTASGDFRVHTGGYGERFRITETGKVGIGLTGPTAMLQLKAGTAAANTAPLKFTSGTNLTTPEAGAVEYDGTNLYYTDSTNTRRTVANTSTAYTSGSTINAGAGAAATPSLSFSGDPDTGLYSSAANTIGISAGGSQIFSLSSNGLVSATAGGASVSTAAGTAAAPTFSFSGDTDTGWYSPLANTLAASTGGSESIRINSSGYVGIGTTNPTRPLHVNTTVTSTTGIEGTYSNLSVSPTANSAGFYTSGWFDISAPSTATKNIGVMVGVLGQVDNLMPAKVIGTQYGAYGYAMNSASSTVTNQSGTYSGTYSTAGSVTNQYGVLSEAANDGAAVTNQYGYYVKNYNVSGTTANRYSIFVDTPTGTATNDYGVYVLSTAKNYFAGNVGIGTSTPTAKLELFGTSTATNGLTPGVSTYLELNPASSSSTSAYNYMGVGTKTTNAQNFTSSLTGGTLESFHDGTGTITGMIGGYGSVVKNNTGPVFSAQALYGRIDNKNATGAITYAYGLFIDAFTRTGAITNSYGVYVNDTTAKNYFGGYVGVGTTNPTGIIDMTFNDTSPSGGLFRVTDTGAASGYIKFDDGTTSAGQFHPKLEVKATGSTRPFTIEMNSSAAHDAGTMPMMVFNTSAAGAVANRPLFDFQNNGSSRMLMNASGSVGIGTTNPGYKLDVAGDVNVSGNFKVNGVNISTGGLSNFTESVNTAAPNATIPVVRLLATNAATNVDVAISSKGTGSLAAHLADGTATGGAKRGSNAVDWQMVRGVTAEVASGNYSTIGGGQTNKATAMNATVAGGSGNIASGASSTVPGGFSNTASGVNAFAAGQLSTASGDYSAAIGRYATAESINQLTVGTYNLPNGTENSGTWVTTDPLFVVGNGTGSGASRSNALMVLKNGNVGIGLNAPSTKLQVAGDISPSVTNNYSLGTASLLFTAVYATNGTIQTSDAKKKRDIASSDLGLDFINRLRPVSYRWMAGPDDDLHYGLIAQETEKAVRSIKASKGKSADPDEQIIVSHDKESDTYGLKYTELISPIIKAIQDFYQEFVTEKSSVKREIASLKERADRAEKENALLRERLDRMEQELNQRKSKR